MSYQTVVNFILFKSFFCNFERCKSRFPKLNIFMKWVKFGAPKFVPLTFCSSLFRWERALGPFSMKKWDQIWKVIHIWGSRKEKFLIYVFELSYWNLYQANSTKLHFGTVAVQNSKSILYKIITFCISLLVSLHTTASFTASFFAVPSIKLLFRVAQCHVRKSTSSNARLQYEAFSLGGKLKV